MSKETLFQPYIPVEVEPLSTSLKPLRVEEGQLVTDDGPITLKGVCVTTHNREDFINKFPGTNTQLLRTFERRLGKDKAEVYDRSLRYHNFQEEDAKFIASMGANAVRWSMSYRYFIDENNPDHIKEDGFEELNNAVEWLSKYGVYTILDFHALPGSQNPDWHSDNPTGHALFWDFKPYKDLQLRFLKETAKRFEGNPGIAGFDLVNEPQTMAYGNDYRYDVLNQYYEDAIRTVRSEDPERICIIEGDGYASRVKDKDGKGEVRLIRPFTDNLMYSGHPYYPAALGRGKYPGEIEENYYTGEVVKHYWDKAKYQGIFNNQQMVVFTKDEIVPYFAGEYGAAFVIPGEEHFRLQALQDQIEVFNEHERPVHRTYWEVKDGGDSGILMIKPDSSYAQLVKDIEAKKQVLKLETWKKSTLPASEIDEKVADLSLFVAQSLGLLESEYGKVNNELMHKIAPEYAAHKLQQQYVDLFEGKSDEEIDDIISGWRIDNCLINTSLYEIISADCRNA